MAAAPNDVADSIPQAANRYLSVELASVKRAGRTIDSTTPQKALHRLRLRCKQLRYLLDFFALSDSLQLKPLARAITPLQVLLGNLQDEHVALATLRDYRRRLDKKSHKQLRRALARQIKQHKSRANELRQAFGPVWAQFDDVVTEKAIRRACEPRKPPMGAS